MKYKLNSLLCSVAIVSTILPLSGCKSENKIVYKRNDEVIYLVNPLDWSKVPEIVNIKINDNYVTMDIDSFYRLLNQEGETINLQTSEGYLSIERDQMRKLADEEFHNFQNHPADTIPKIMTTMAEATALVSIGKKAKEKIKNHS